MYYVSTRDAGRRLTASQAIVEGLSRDGGLYLPEEIPQLTMDEIKALAALSYPERAAKIMKSCWALRKAPTARRNLTRLPQRPS